MTSDLQSAAPAAEAAVEPTRQPLKIGIVSPYGYPHPGGVNEHVRFTYEAMRRMGHDVWIITSKYGRERESEGNVIRLGTGWAARKEREKAEGMVGRLASWLAANRRAVLRNVKSVRINPWILGGNFRFSTKSNDPLNAKFYIFQIQSNGSYKLVN